MRVERDTLGYMIREEIGRDKLKGRAGLRGWRFERRLCEGKGGELARKCWRKRKERMEKGKKLSRIEEGELLLWKEQDKKGQEGREGEE